MLPSEKSLLDVLQTAADASGAEYRRFVLDWLNRAIGFDGVVWGSGQRLADGSIRIDGAEVTGRPAGLLAEFGDLAAADPVSRRFAADPRGVQCIDVARDYAAPEVRPVADYLERYQVRHLMLCGATTGQGSLAWLTLYREDRARPFDPAAATLAGFAVPFALLAGRQRGLPETQVAGAGLTQREREVAVAYATGEGYKAIARNLGLAPSTVRCHLQTIFRKLGVHNKVELGRRLESGSAR